MRPSPGDRVACVHAIIDVLGDLGSRLSVVVDEAIDAIGRMDLALPQGRMNESVAQSLAIAATVVIATDAQRCDQGMVDGFLVVSVVRGPILLAMDFDRKAIDIDRSLADSTSAWTHDMSLDRISKSVADGFEIGGVCGQDADQS